VRVEVYENYISASYNAGDLQGRSRAGTEVESVHILFLTRWTRPPGTFVSQIQVTYMYIYITYVVLIFSSYSLT